MNSSSTEQQKHSDFLSQIVRIFLQGNLSLILVIGATLLGLAALFMTPREEDPQIVVPMADILVQAPGHDAVEVEQLVATPLERMLSQIDGVEYVYSMSRDDSAVITVRFFVGQDRERSLVKLFKKLSENSDRTPAIVKNWVLKPIEIDDVPIVTLTLSGADGDTFQLRRMGEELVERLAGVRQVNRAYVVGGESREVRIELDPEKLESRRLTFPEVQRVIAGANAASPAGSFTRDDKQNVVRTSALLVRSDQLGELVVGVFEGLPVYLKELGTIREGAQEPDAYVRIGWGPAARFETHSGSPGSILGLTQPLAIPSSNPTVMSSHRPLDQNTKLPGESVPAVTIAVSKQKGANAVTVSQAILAKAEELKTGILPENVQLTVTRNNGMVADEKVNELIEALGIAIVIVILLLTIGLGWREALVVAIAIPVVFGLTLFVNLLLGYTINRVTLFALILALGLLVDDPIVDVENIARHFHARKKAAREIVLAAVAEIRPPLISATLAVIVSFLPMFFFTGMMGPYMSPMALNVPVAMLMSMVVAFTITPWLTYQLLKGHFGSADVGNSIDAVSKQSPQGSLPESAYDPVEVQKTWLYRLFRPLMLPLLRTRRRAIFFLMGIAGLTVAAMGLGVWRQVPLKMLPFDNKNEFLLVVDLDEGASLERTRAVLSRFELEFAATPEVINFVSYAGTPGPIDFNGMVRHYYLRTNSHQGEIRVNLVGKKNRDLQSHGILLRLRDRLTELAEEMRVQIRLVELPPGPPVLASIVAEIYGEPETPYTDLLRASQTVANRMRREPGLAEVDDISEREFLRWTFVPDYEKAALNGVSVEEIGKLVAAALGGAQCGTLRAPGERQELILTVQLPRAIRSDVAALEQLSVKGNRGQLIRLNELGQWRSDHQGQTIYHKNLERVAYVFAESLGRPPADCIVDLLADRTLSDQHFVADVKARPVQSRSFFTNGSGIAWSVPRDIRVKVSGEGEWQITLDVFRDLGLAFGAAMVLIYIILVAQTGSFLIPMIVMLAIPLTALGVMPGFYLLNLLSSQEVGGIIDPVYFTATAMIGMIALAGIVTRDSIILVDFMEQAVRGGRPLFDAILESRVVRLRPILLTAGAAMLSAIPITLDPIFSGLGWSLIFGLLASTVFTLFVIPVTYRLVFFRPNQG